MVVEAIKDEFYRFFSVQKHAEIERIFTNLNNQLNHLTSVENFKRQFFINLLKEITYLVKEDVINHRDFEIDTLKKDNKWKPLAKLILLKRIKELKNSQVEKKGKKYYIEDLKNTYFGKFITDRLDYSRRKVLEEDEYEKIVKAIKKLNYEVPIVVQPTETEKFFND
jgi:phage host-nuclease inhibitor protein Gam